MKYLMTAVGVAVASALTGLALAEPLSKSMAARIEAIPIQTLTISDEKFLKEDSYGQPTTIAGVLRVAQGSGRLPLVILAAGSGGFGSVVDVWDRQFEEMGISTFAMDSFAGRGIVNTLVDQSQLGRLNMILDIYRSLGALAAHPRVDPARVAVMGWSRGGQAALYSSVKRFQKMWNFSGIDLAAYIALYPECNTSYISESEVSDRPIRIFHGTSDDWVPIGSCRGYFERLRHSAKDVKMVEYSDTSHAFDYPNIPPTPTTAQNSQAMLCTLKEEPLGTILNTETQKPFTYSDTCVTRNPHVAYSAVSTHATEETVKSLLKGVFALQ